MGKITNESIAHIFAKYLGCNASSISNMKGIIYSVSYYMDNEESPKIKVLMDNMFVQYASDDVYVLVNPVSSMTDDDYIHVALVLSWGRDILGDRLNGIKLGDKTVKYWRDAAVRIGKDELKKYDLQNLPAHLFQFLTQRGIALPQTVIQDGEIVTFTVDELYKYGIFKNLN